MEILVNTDPGNGLVLDSTKPLSEPMLTYFQQSPLKFIQGYVYLNTQDINPQIVFKIYTFEITATSPSGQWVYDIKIIVLSYKCYDQTKSVNPLWPSVAL